MGEGRKITVTIIVCIAFIIFYAILSLINFNDDIFGLLYCFSLGIITAALTIYLSRNYIFGLVFTGVYTSTQFLVIFLLIPAIQDFILKLPTYENSGPFTWVINSIVFIFFRVLLCNIASFSLTYLLVKTFTKLLNRK